MSDMNASYEYPSALGIKPMGHQVTTVDFLDSHNRAFCFNDIGTGKTLSGLWALDRRLQRKPKTKILIIAPVSTLNFTWGEAIFKNFPHWFGKWAVLLGSKEKRWRMLNEDKQIYLINPDGLSVVKEHPWFFEIDHIVVDESTAFKTPGTERFKNLKRLIHDKTSMWMMSGSPMPQSPMDIYGQAKLCCPEALPRNSITSFKFWAMVQVSQFKWVPRKGVDKDIAEFLEPYTVRFTRDQCLDLPPVEYIEMGLEPSKELQDMARILQNEATMKLAAGSLDTMNEGVLRSKLLQAMCGGVKYTADNPDADGAPVHWVNCATKLDALEDIAESSEGPVIVFSPFKAPLRLLSAWATRKGYSHSVVHGDIPYGQRDLAFKALMNNEIKFLFAQPDTMSHGLTLTRSNVIVWWGLPERNEIFEQATGRIIRAGQTRKQLVYYFISHPLERIILHRLKNNQALQGSLLELLSKVASD